MFQGSLKIIRRIGISYCNFISFTHPIMATESLVYHNLPSILTVLNAPQYESNESVKELLNIYQKALEERQKVSEEKKYPFIVLEGLDGCGKSTVGKRLAKRINATLWCTPPKSTSHLRPAFEQDKDLHSAYYSLGNYIAALEIFVHLQSSPVVLDRYWHSTCVYGLAQAVHDFPEQYEMFPSGDKYYEWPSDLMKPDKVLLLKVSEEERIKRLSRRQNLTEQEEQLKASQLFRENVVTAYTNTRDPGVEVINGDPDIPAVLKQIHNKIKYLLQ